MRLVACSVWLVGKAGFILGLMLSGLASAQTVPTRFGEVTFSRGEAGGQQFVTGRAEFSHLAPPAETPPLGECELSVGVLRSSELDPEAYGAEAGEQGQEAPISAGPQLSVEAGGRTLFTLDASGPGYLLSGGPTELLRRIGGVAGPLPQSAVLNIPGQSGAYGFPAFRVLLPDAPEFAWQSPDTLEASDILRWKGASRNPQARVKILLRQGQGQSAQNVICAAPDTGSFQLPEAVRRELSGSLRVVGAFRTLETVTREGDAELRVQLEEGGLR